MSDQTTETVEPATDSAAPATAVDPAQKADPNLFSNIKGADVIGKNDESIGSIADILIDESGSLRGVVIAHGGLLGLGQTYRQYDMPSLPQVTDGKVTLDDLDMAALEGMPEYTYPEAQTGRAATSEAPAEGVGSTGAAPDQSAAAPAANGMSSSSAESGLWPVSQLVGASIGAEEDKASISDLRFEGDKAAAALIDKGSLGLGNKVEEV